MYGSKYFQIRSGEPIVIATLSTTGSHPQGLGMAKDTNFSNTSDDDNPMSTPAGADDCLGILSQRVGTTGPSLLKNLLNMTADEEVKSGSKVALLAIPVGAIVEIECPPDIAYNADQPADLTEGYLLVTSGTGALTTTTAAQTRLGYQNGRLRSVQSGDRAMFVVTQNLSDDAVDSGNVRLEMQRIEGALTA